MLQRTTRQIALTDAVRIYYEQTAAAMALLLEHGRPHTPAELADHECLAFANGSGPEWTFRRDSRSKSKPEAVKVKGRLKSNNLVVLLKARFPAAARKRASTR